MNKKNLKKNARYWINSIKPKKKNLWVFSGFRGKGYLDNTKYFFEYVLENHPEIEAYWITKDKAVFQRLKEEGKPVLKMGTSECRDIVSRAKIGVSDHYKMSDFDIKSGRNDGLKIVQLWHGVSLKDFKGLLEKTTIKGIKYDHGIFKEHTDKVVKPLKYLRCAYRSEMFEKYLLFMCPGQEQKEKVIRDAHIPEAATFICGFPRNYYLHTQSPDIKAPKILYAPTYRWNAENEEAMIDLLCDSGEQLDNYLQSRNATLTVRLHPHTWRNHSEKLLQLEEEYSAIEIDKEKDVYKNIGTYSMIISDYSSIAMDFVLMDRPCIFLDFDREDFIINEGGFSMDYDEYSPGPKVKSWDEAIKSIEEYLKDSQKDAAWRERVRNVFFDMSVNDKDNSERIIQEIKRRINWI